ncbi:hypothetical protein OWV82_020823 [Melia azedarach]|uniref:Uncharacterized protein n=1 Tax=Melia azedarach TaxID=155640 RepID=A0ACC1X7Z1_MELAZ|nr:hypothetical protein OWV82_020823 [Melia azedarach]
MGFSLPLFVMMLLINTTIIHCTSPPATATATNISSPPCNGGTSIYECLMVDDEDEGSELIMDSVGSSSLVMAKKPFLITSDAYHPVINCNRKPYATCLAALNLGRKIPENCLHLFKGNLNRDCFSLK